MARQPRVEFEGAFHHVMSRGNDGITVFRDDDDRQLFLDLLAEEVVRSRWVLHDYCLMGNHYHLAIATPECTLSSGMHRLLTRYVQRFNKRHGRRGHLFQERFKSVLVEKESHGIVLTRYIALNPVRAGFCSRPEEWRWSSYAARSGCEPPPPWLTLGPLAEQFGATSESQQRAFREYVLDAAGLDDDALVEAPLAGLFLGTASWIDRIQGVIDTCNRSEEHPRAQVHPGRPELDDVLEAVAATFDTTSANICSGHGTLERQLVAYFAFEEALTTLRAIGSRLGLTSAGHVSSLVKRCRTQLVDDSALRELAEACRSRMRRRPPPFLQDQQVVYSTARQYHRAASKRMR